MQRTRALGSAGTLSNNNKNVYYYYAFLTIAVLGLSCQYVLLLSELTSAPPGSELAIEIENLNAATSSGTPRIDTNTIKRLDDLHHVSLPHGSFYFGPDSHSVAIPGNDTLAHSWTAAQEQALGDEEIDIELEKRRCASYGYNFNVTAPARRRRLFLGALVADDSLEVLRAVGTEAYNVYHAVSFVESNVTQNLTPRKWRFWEDGGGPSSARRNLHQVYQLFGPKTKVSIDYYITSRTSTDGDEILHEKLQKEGINLRWKNHGMKPTDVAIVTDADETFTRDFLRALQICEVPQFITQEHRSCKSPKVLGSTLVMESSGNCIKKGRRWYHPDAALGECIDLVGSTALHPPTKRDWRRDKNNENATFSHGGRSQGYGREGHFDSYHRAIANGSYPLWTASDIRSESGGVQVSKKNKSPTGYHFHNFFTSAEEIHFKYSTYGHAAMDAMSKPIWELHEDLEFGVRCATAQNKMGDVEKFGDAIHTSTPVYYLNEEVLRKGHSAWQNIVRKEEEKYGNYSSP